MQHDCALHSHEIPRPTGSQRGLVLFCGGAPCVLQPRARHVAPMLRTDATMVQFEIDANKRKKQQGIHHHLAGTIQSATDQHARSRKNHVQPPTRSGARIDFIACRNCGGRCVVVAGTEWACHATRIVGASRPDQHWRSSKGVGDLETRRRRRLRDGTDSAWWKPLRRRSQRSLSSRSQERQGWGAEVVGSLSRLHLSLSPPSLSFPLRSSLFISLLLPVFLSLLSAFLFSSLQFLFVIIFCLLLIRLSFR